MKSNRNKERAFFLFLISILALHVSAKAETGGEKILPINNGGNLESFYGDVTIQFGGIGTCYLHNEYIYNEYDSFVVKFTEPITEVGVSIQANPYSYEIPIGTSVISGLFSKNQPIAFSLKSESACTIHLGQIIFVDSTQEHMARINSNGINGRKIEWTDSDGIEHHLVLSNRQHENINFIGNIFSGELTLNGGEYIGGEIWAAKRDSATPLRYKIEFDTPVENNNGLVWYILTEDGETRYINIEEGSNYSIVTSTGNVKDCRLMYIDEPSKHININIKKVSVENFSITEVSLRETKLKEVILYDLFGRKYKSKPHGIYIEKSKSQGVIKRINM